MSASNLRKRVARSEATSVGELRRAAAQFAEEASAAVGVRDAVRLAVSEAVTNVVIHAYPVGETGEIVIDGQCVGDHLILVVADRGCGMSRAPDVSEPGLGHSLIGQLAEEVVVSRRDDGGGTLVIMSFALDQASLPTCATPDGSGAAA